MPSLHSLCGGLFAGKPPGTGGGGGKGGKGGKVDKKGDVVMMVQRLDKVQ